MISSFAGALQPLWWVLRGWVLYTLVVLTAAFWNRGVDQRFVPRSAAGWAILTGVVLFSVHVGRGLGRGRRWFRRFLAVINLVALVLVLPTLASFSTAVQQRLAFASSYPVYIQGPAAAPVPTNGVFVDGMQVSNLFVYDAVGNPLTQVQVFDDRGRPVRTTYDGGQQQWSLPGVTEPWTFLPSQDEDGRNRWNVYPLSGLPSAQLEYDGITALPRPLDGETPRVPPRPFAKAPAVVTPSGPGVLTPVP